MWVWRYRLRSRGGSRQWPRQRQRAPTGWESSERRTPGKCPHKERNKIAQIIVATPSARAHIASTPAIMLANGATTMKKLQLTRQAPEATTGAADGDEPESKRKQVSKRLYIDAAGAEVDHIEEATGARYVLLNPNGNVNFDEQLGDAGKLATMCAIMGFVTKVGNVANTVLNDKDEPGTFDDASAAIQAFIDSAKASPPVWAERSTGVPGAKVDRDALAGAICEVGQAAGKIAAADVDAMYAKVREKLESDPAYLRGVRQIPDVARAYATRVGKPGKTIEDFLA